MKLKPIRIDRFFITIFILVSINIFGFYNFYKDGLFQIFNTFDLFIILLNLVFFAIFTVNKKFRRICLIKPLKYLFYFYVVVLIAFFSMPLRGPTSVLDAMRVGRYYLIIPLAFLIYYDVLTENKGLYYFKLFQIISIISACQIIINAISPDFINLIFTGIGRAEAEYYNFYQRNVLLSKTMIFPHILAVYYYYKIITKKFNLNNLVMFLFLLLASSLQGFRVYLIILIFILALITILYGKNIKNFIRWTVISIIVLSITIILDIQVLNNQIYGKFYTAYYDITHDTGSYHYRLETVKIRQIFLLLEKPFFGWGFIYYNSAYGRQLAIPAVSEESRIYGLYSVDSGYITILMQFGFLGVLLILYLYLKLSVFLFKEMKKNPAIFITTIGAIFFLIFSLYTHGAFFREFGILPFTIMIGITASANSSIKLISK